MPTFAELEVLGRQPAELFRITHEGDVWLWTNSNESIVKNAETYEPTMVLASAISANEEAHTNNIELTVELTNPVAALFRDTQPPSPVGITIFRWQREADDVDPDLNYSTHFSGQIKSCVFGETSAVLHCGPIHDVVKRKIGTLLYQPTCNNRLYDDRCQVSRAAFTYVHDVLEMTGLTNPADPDGLLGGMVIRLDAAALALFVGGLINQLEAGVAVFDSPTGMQRQMIVAHSGDIITILDNFIGLEVGSELTLYAGCKKTVAVCHSKFNNLPRFQGFPNVPTKNPFDGGSLL